ncbi:MAG: phosphate uptake regulator PhoU [Candidatus Woesearchaeota archaeon]
MEIRRLVKSGNTSFTIVLPKPWIDKNKLKKGDLVYLKENSDNTLTLSEEPKKKAEETEKTIVVGKRETILILRELRAAYLQDMKKIIILFPKDRKDLPQTISDVKREITQLVALEVLEESSRRIVAKSFLDYTEVSVSELIRRVDNMTRSMLLDSMSCIEHPSRSQSICDRDIEVNRLVFLIFKILLTCSKDPEIARENGLTNPGIIKYWHLSFLMEEIADIAKRVSRKIECAINMKRKFDKKMFKAVFKEGIELYCGTMKAIYLKDYTKEVDLKLRVRSAQSKCDMYIEKCPGPLTGAMVGRLKQLLSKVKDIAKLAVYLE